MIAAGLNRIFSRHGVMLLSVLFVLFINTSIPVFSAVPYLDESLREKNDKSFVMLDFYSPHCGTCLRLEPYYLQIRQRFRKQVTFRRVNFDRPSKQKIGDKYSVDGTPTYILFDGKTGKPIYRMKDLISVGVLIKQLERMTGRLKTWEHSMLNKKDGGYTLVAFQPYKNCDKLCQRYSGAVNAMSYAMEGRMPGIFLDVNDPNVRSWMKEMGLNRKPAYALFDHEGHLLYYQDGGLRKEQMWQNIQLLTDLGL